METANEGRFSSQKVYASEWVDGVLNNPLNFYSLTYLLSSILIIIIPTLRNYQLAHFTSIQSINKNKKSIRQSWHWQVPFLFFFFSPGSAWSCKTGKRMMKSHPSFFRKAHPTHQVRVQKTSPQVNSNVLAHSLSRTDTSMEGILDKGTYCPRGQPSTTQKVLILQGKII